MNGRGLGFSFQDSLPIPSSTQNQSVLIVDANFIYIDNKLQGKVGKYSFRFQIQPNLGENTLLHSNVMSKRSIQMNITRIRSIHKPKSSSWYA